jgi:hypothetical protein
MRRTSRWLAAAGLAVALTFGLHSAREPEQPVVLTPTAAAAPVDRSPSAGTLALDAGDWDVQPDAYRGGWVVMQPWEADRIPDLRAKNPDIEILMYQDASATDATACTAAEDGTCTQDLDQLPAGVGYWWAQENNPEWFLRTEEGEILEWSDYPGLHPMDIANPEYQQTWLANVRAELDSADWDGVMLDDTLTTLSHPTYGDATSPTIPDDAAMYDATTSFLAAVGPALHDAGYLAVPNVTVDADNWRSTLDQWTPYVSGWENEYLVKYGLGWEERFGGAEWQWRVDLLDWGAEHHVPIIPVTYGSVDDLATQTYHRATWLLAWNGEDGASMYVPEEEDTSFWLPNAVIDVGQPVAARAEIAPGVFLRRYDEGVVVVNSGDEPAHVPLGGRYLDGDTRLDTVDLGARSAAVLRGPAT